MRAKTSQNERKTVKQLWNEYAAAWSNPDRAARHKILEKRLTPDVEYADPAVQTSGYEEMNGASFAEIGSEGRLCRIRGFFVQPSA
jgi:hypothetical protein